MLAAPPRELVVRSPRNAIPGVGQQMSVIRLDSPESVAATSLHFRNSREVNNGKSGEDDGYTKSSAGSSDSKSRSPAKQRSWGTTRVQSSSISSRVFLEEPGKVPGAVVEKRRFSAPMRTSQDGWRYLTFQGTVLYLGVHLLPPMMSEFAILNWN